jgi:plastocyanin
MIGLFVLVVVFIVLLVRGIGGDGGAGGDDAGAILRARLARGEIAPDEYERLRAVLGVSAQPRGARWQPAALAALALAVLLILGALLGGLNFGGLGLNGPNTPWGGMMGPGMMGGPMMGGTYGPGASGSPVAGEGVGMKGSAFSPANLLVRAGATVVWTNDDAIPHTATADDRSWSSGDLQPGATYRRTFTTPGSYPYTCLYHPWMRGTITVEG